MKFVAKKSQCCVRAGHVCHEFETDDVQKMADYILAAYSYGADGCDRRDDDYACVYNCLADFESENFSEEDEKETKLADYVGVTPYAELPADSKLLYMSGGYGWDLVPVSSPRQIIDELISVDWADLVIEFDD